MRCSYFVEYAWKAPAAGCTPQVDVPHLRQRGTDVANRGRGASDPASLGCYRLVWAEWTCLGIERFPALQIASAARVREVPPRHSIRRQSCDRRKYWGIAQSVLTDLRLSMRRCAPAGLLSTCQVSKVAERGRD